MDHLEAAVINVVREGKYGVSSATVRGVPDVYGALHLLSPLRRDAFLLHAVSGLSQKEIARKLGKSVGSVAGSIAFAKGEVIAHITGGQNPYARARRTPRAVQSPLRSLESVSDWPMHAAEYEQSFHQDGDSPNPSNNPSNNPSKSDINVARVIDQWIETLAYQGSRRATLRKSDLQRRNDTLVARVQQSDTRPHVPQQYNRGERCDYAMISEDDLTQLFQSGDEGAFAEVYKRDKCKVYGAVYGYVRNRETASDLVQDAFLRAFRKIGTFRGIAKPSTWIAKIAIHLAIDHSKRKSNTMTKTGYESTGYIDGTYAGKESNPVVQVRSDELRDIIQSAIGELRERNRQALLLRARDGLSYKEIAVVLNIPLGTVMSRIHYGRKQLKVLLEAKGIDISELIAA